MYEKVSTDLNFVEREKKVERFWEEQHIFERAWTRAAEGKTLLLLRRPPTANGKPHIGHVLTASLRI
jgi:isoleucyl-tRNA synthetase